MSNPTLVLILLAVMALAYYAGFWRSRQQAAGLPRGSQHSRPVYHASLLAFWAAGPALLLLGLWLLLEPWLISRLVLDSIPAGLQLDANAQVVLMRRLHNLASGYGVTGEVAGYEHEAAARLLQLQQYATLIKTTLLALVVAAGSALTLRRMQLQFRAREQVERLLRLLLLGCSALAILTTLGIVLSMLGETLRFFSFVSPGEFFLGTRWAPAFSSSGTAHGDYGLLPLLWGTLMVSLIAMLVAIPLGLMTAIYLAEYAPARVRDIAKPVIEILAGIPTIVYGVFAMLLVGPLFAAAGELLGIQVRATSALTAGVVMGIMIVPFVSSLSDDIITRVPQSLRDGSLGLGATRSETIRQVVLPAALPGIVGAFLLAVSRAIGETMIVVLAAGNSPQLHANPLEAISTVTVSIVNQLTGDTDFAGPQSLVAFALGLTLFAITLLLNVVALYIVRKYREQYE